MIKKAFAGFFFCRVGHGEGRGPYRALLNHHHRKIISTETQKTAVSNCLRRFPLRTGPFQPHGFTRDAPP
ncbi:hypothetical protein GJ688_19210 [Heliobacillus mobilis]|uniref:Uncharacterized protein n=1 Tax=Heliobacterium mobile TaxID=28064 RepID=A0A6I3SRN9_HELMO|nr:hypothetical protein [Heliobacterium mobile]